MTMWLNIFGSCRGCKLSDPYKVQHGLIMYFFRLQNARVQGLKQKISTSNIERPTLNIE